MSNYLAKSGMKPDAARQAIARAKPPVSKLQKLSLPQRENFVFLDKDYGTPNFFRSLAKLFETTNSSYKYLLRALVNRGGMWPAQYLASLSGCPQIGRKHLLARQVLELYELHGLVKRFSDQDYGEVVELNKSLMSTVPSTRMMRSRLLIEEMIIASLLSWLQQNAIIAWGKGAARNIVRMPNFASRDWDIAGPSYLSPIRDFVQGKNLPGFVVAEVLYDDDVSVDAIEYVVRKHQDITAIGSHRKYLPIIVAKNFHPDALKYGKRNGFWIATIDALFGKDVASSLSELAKILAGSATEALKDPAKLDLLLGQLSKLHGNVLNTRGVLFELMVGHLVGDLGGKVELGRVAEFEGERADIDVFRQNGTNEIFCYECKGIHKKNRVGKDEILKWINEKIPVWKGWLRNDSQYGKYQNHQFEFWTSGEFDKEASGIIERYSRQSNIRFMERASVVKFMRENRTSSRIKESFVNQF